MVSLFGQRALVKADALSLFERGELGSCIMFGVVIAFCGFVFSLFCFVRETQK